MKAALAHAPAEPPPLDRLGNNVVDGYQAYNTELTHVVGGVLKGTAGLVNFTRGLNPTDPYNLTHPAAYMQNVSMTLSGPVSTAAHPERIVTAVVDGFKKDPSEFVGRLIPELPPRAPRATRWVWPRTTTFGTNRSAEIWRARNGMHFETPEFQRELPLSKSERMSPPPLRNGRAASS
ncbi:hypothetical protein [Streptomyces californicus]|uniref:hypothetical protein n=1 Tax=Streptomyces californicus TaxID=67351 RepID=UPI0004BF4BD5|nr:hypothetical protein [Streptomyces californicus]QRV57140.1 hypothetical protein I6J40_25365 [Streptomyces californicus]